LSSAWSRGVLPISHCEVSGENLEILDCSRGRTKKADIDWTFGKLKARAGDDHGVQEFRIQVSNLAELYSSSFIGDTKFTLVLKGKGNKTSPEMLILSSQIFRKVEGLQIIFEPGNVGSLDSLDVGPVLQNIFPNGSLNLTLNLAGNKIQAFNPNSFPSFSSPNPFFAQEIQNSLRKFLNSSYRENIFGVKIGQKHVQKPVQLKLDLSDNYLSSIPEIPFASFFSRKSKVGSELIVGGNPLVCDWRGKWLRERTNLSLVRGFDCVNDPGESIFTSEFVDKSFPNGERGPF